MAKDKEFTTKDRENLEKIRAALKELTSKETREAFKEAKLPLPINRKHYHEFLDYYKKITTNYKQEILEDRLERMEKKIDQFIESQRAQPQPTTESSSPLPTKLPITYITKPVYDKSGKNFKQALMTIGTHTLSLETDKDDKNTIIVGIQDHDGELLFEEPQLEYLPDVKGETIEDKIETITNKYQKIIQKEVD